MKKILGRALHKTIKIILIIVLASITPPLAADSDVKALKSYKVGLILPLSGELSELGQGIHNSALLAAEDLQLKGLNLEIIAEDNQGDLLTSAGLSKKLIYEEKVNFVVSIISGVGLVINPIAEQEKVIHVGICSNPNVAKGAYNFINYLTAKDSVKKYLKELNRLYPSGAKLSIFALNEAGFQEIVAELQNQIVNTKHKIVSNEAFVKNADDFKAQIIKASLHRPDLELILGFSPEIELLAKQFRDLGKKQGFSSIESFGFAKNIDLFEGHWFIDAAVPDTKFRERYQSKFKIQATAGCGHMYDTIMLFGKILLHKKSDNLLSAFKQIKEFNGVIGRSVVSKSGIIHSEPSVKVIVNGQILLQDPNVSF